MYIYLYIYITNFYQNKLHIPHKIHFCMDVLCLYMIFFLPKSSIMLYF